MKSANDDWMSRRTLIRALVGLGGIALIDCNTSSSAGPDGGSGADGSATRDGSSADAATFPDGGSSACVLSPSVTKGPYWIDEKLERSDIRSDTNNVASPNPRPGLPLAIQFAVFSYSGGACAPLPNAQVDIWHCDAGGTYSDVSNMGGANATGQNFCRGYQLTSAAGLATFTTLYPGWYMGRAVHIHVKVRLFNAANNTTTEATTQVFFDDNISDAVYATGAPYQTGTRDTRNASDMIYGGHTETLVNLQGSATTGYTATIAIGVALGTVFPG